MSDCEKRTLIEECEELRRLCLILFAPVLRLAVWLLDRLVGVLARLGIDEREDVL
jgi:hypothetical protein